VQSYLKKGLSFHKNKKRPPDKSGQNILENYLTNFTSVLLFNALPAAVLLVELDWFLQNQQ
jgi:hypothetical protein